MNKLIIFDWITKQRVDITSVGVRSLREKLTQHLANAKHMCFVIEPQTLKCLLWLPDNTIISSNQHVIYYTTPAHYITSWYLRVTSTIDKDATDYHKRNIR